MQGRLWRAVLLVLALAGLAWPAAAAGVPVPAAPKAADGVLDLRGWNFADGAVRLSGDWAIWWGELLGPQPEAVRPPDGHLAVPGLWNGKTLDGKDLSGTGGATYHLRVLLPAGAPALGLRLGELNSAGRLWVDGVLAAEVGAPSLDPAAERPRFRVLHVSLPAGRAAVDLVLEVSNHYHSEGGIRQASSIGPDEPLRLQRWRQLAISVLVIGAAAAFGLYHGILFSGRRDPSYAWLGLFALVLGVRALSSSNLLVINFPDIPQVVNTRLDYLALFAAMPLYLLLLNTMYPRDVSRRVALAAAAAGSACILALATPPAVFSHLRDPWFAVLVAGFAYGAWGLLRAARRRRQGALVILGFGLLLLAAVVRDVFISQRVAETIELTPIAVVLLLVAHGGVLGARFDAVFRRNQALAARLTELNQSLERRVGERTRELHDSMRATEAAAAVKSEFLAVMSHEIRTTLNGITGMVRILGDTRLDGGQRDMVETLRHSADGLLAIVNGILDLAKLEAGKVELEEADFDVGALVGSVVALMSSRAQEKGLDLAVQLDPAVPQRLRGDANRLRQVLLNLVGNAVKFTERGAVVVSVAAQGRGPDGRTVLGCAVRDTGIGIAPEAQDKLFARFAQADASIAGRFGGTGLGLSISRRLVELMGGEIGVDSAPGQGSTFRFTCPLGAAADREPAAAAAPQALAPLRLLLAEDNPVNQKVALALLGRQHQVTAVADGAAALAAVTAQTFDAVLMDVQMPLMDGMEATRRIRALAGPVARIPIVAMTANALPGDRERCLAAGMDGYVTKPLSRDALVEELRAVTAGTPAEA